MAHPKTILLAALLSMILVRQCNKQPKASPVVYQMGIIFQHPLLLNLILAKTNEMLYSIGNDPSPCCCCSFCVFPAPAPVERAAPLAGRRGRAPHAHECDGDVNGDGDEFMEARRVRRQISGQRCVQHPCCDSSSPHAVKCPAAMPID
jgi:hypothetical protein